MPVFPGPKSAAALAGTAIEEAIFNQEEARAGVQFTYFMTGLHMLLPALMEFSVADEASLARVAPAVRGDEIWCQLFLRTVERFRFGRHPDDGGAARVMALGLERPKGLEQRGAGGGLWHGHRPHRCECAQAQRPVGISGST